MKNPKFKEIRPNYRKSVLEITLQQGRRSVRYSLPFSAVGAAKAHSRNRFARIKIDKALDSEGAFFLLEDGTKGSFPADLVLYYCDPTHDWSPMHWIKHIGRV